MTRALVFGSRSLTTRHLTIMRLVARHAMFEGSARPLADWMKMADNEERLWELRPLRLHDGGSFLLMHADDMPSRRSGAIGAAKLAECAARIEWAGQWTSRRFSVEHDVGVEKYEVAEERRNAAIIAAKPNRIYCVHPHLDKPGASLNLANALTRSGLRFWHIHVTHGGAVVTVEER